MYYFAFGSNMNFQRMKGERCPTAEFICRGKLEGYRFVYDKDPRSKGAYANVIPADADVVWGAVWEVDAPSLEVLDKREGCNAHKKCYERKEMIIEGDDGEEYEAITYYRAELQEAEPSAEYQAIVVQGGIDAGLPKDYIENVLKQY